MKKLLAILTTITSLSSITPIILANASAEIPENKIINKEINSFKTNNLENLSRVKREIKNNYFLQFILKVDQNYNIYYSPINVNNNIYFIGAKFKDETKRSFYSKFYKYNLINQNLESIETLFENGNGNALGCVYLNNKIYIRNSASGLICEYNPETKEKKYFHQHIGDKTDYHGKNANSIIVNDKIYYIENWSIYVSDLDGKNKVQILKNKHFSSIFNINNNIYLTNSEKIYKYEPFELIESNINDMKEHAKRGLYLQHKKQNPNSEIKDILNINLENLTVSNVIIDEEQKNKSFNSEENLESACKDSASTFINKSNSEQTQYTISCSKQFTETNTFQKMNGFSKSNSTSNTENWSWNVNTKVTVKASGEAGIPLVAKGKVEVGVEVGAGYTWGGSKTYTVGNTSNSSDTEIKTTTSTTTIAVPSQPVKVPPHSKISIFNSSWKNNIQLTLNVFQKVDGRVSVDFIDKNNNKTTISISIKDAMLNLLENNILPSKIKINDDDSINFSYNIKSKKEIIMHQTEIGEAIPLTLDEQNITFKDNTTSIIVEKN
ncbi:ETX/MTX2 family pore-forming toxin [Spiroplasma endosymbiont of Dilophus febrilis]|uniref:ETX/MTX2 family pore-forming toxin n=1 Tax=Spiroplasma endosymbiont of Dilophus febrilis TaxID=3066292 RepID=UPI00313BFE42